MNTANRGKIVVMLYSGAITFLGKAKLYMEKKDIQNKSKYIQKALDIIEELNIALDLQKGKDIAANLRSIYLFLIRFLTQANIDNSTEKIDRAVHILSRLKSAFDEIVQNPDYEEAHEHNKKEQCQNSIRKIV
jgi:flagellar protein FliS